MVPVQRPGVATPSLASGSIDSKQATVAARSTALPVGGRSLAGRLVKAGNKGAASPVRGRAVPRPRGDASLSAQLKLASAGGKPGAKARP